MKQLTFPHPMICTHIYPDGREEKVRYGQYEAILIVTENGWDVDRTITLQVPFYIVEEVVKVDGTKVIFHEPLRLINTEEFGDGSGRKARRIFN